MRTERWVDLHVHTTCSDGTDTPEAVAALAAARGVSLLAVTDHDTDAGVKPARRACERLGLALLPAVEFDAACERGELHLLAYGVDTRSAALRLALLRADAALVENNLNLLRNIQRAGYAIEVDPTGLSGPQLHVAIRSALFAAGLARDRKEVYREFMANPAFRHNAQRLTGREVLAAVAEAGGVASLAHPCKLRVDDEATVRFLAEAGLWGIEAYYGDGGQEYIPRALELARRYGLRPTIGSDYHGRHRDSALGMRVPDDPALWEALEELRAMAEPGDGE